VRPLLALSAAAAAVLCGGCGGGSKATTRSAGAPVLTTTVATATAPPATTPTAVATGPARPRRGAPTVTAPATPPPATKTAAGGATNVRVPATFQVLSGGRMVPPTVSAPAFLAVQVTVIARDGRPHRVLIRTPRPHTLVVPPAGEASILIGGLRQGLYPILLDGRPGAALVIGGEPGP
jgi:hypothetical protein